MGPSLHPLPAMPGPPAQLGRLAAAAAVAALSFTALPCPGACERVVSIADLHGDFRHAMVMLQAAGLAEEGNDNDLQGPDGRPFALYKGVRWIGGNTTLVQTGDMVDRGAYARDLYALFAELRRQAPAAGGRVVNLVGNHDLMCMQGDLRYVSKEDQEQFGGSSARRAAFAPTGWVGRQILEEFRTAFLAGETLYVHAGLLEAHVEHGLDALDEEFRKQLRASISSGSVEGALLKASGPLWIRRLAEQPERSVCPVVAKVLKRMGARRMVLGHTQVEDGAVRPRCGGRLLMADTIIGKAGYPMCWQEGSMQVAGCQGSLSFVEIRDGEAQAVRVPPLSSPVGAVLEEVPLPILGGAAEEL